MEWILLRLSTQKPKTWLVCTNVNWTRRGSEEGYRQAEGAKKAEGLRKPKKQKEIEERKEPYLLVLPNNQVARCSFKRDTAGNGFSNWRPKPVVPVFSFHMKPLLPVKVMDSQAPTIHQVRRVIPNYAGLGINRHCWRSNQYGRTPTRVERLGILEQDRKVFFPFPCSILV